MGKRSVRTPRGRLLSDAMRSVLPLIPYLRRRPDFRRACCGEGDLIRHLELFGLNCVHSGDIRFGQDALAVKHYIGSRRRHHESAALPRVRQAPRLRITARSDPALPRYWPTSAVVIPYDWSANKGCEVPAALFRHRRDSAAEMDPEFRTAARTIAPGSVRSPTTSVAPLPQ